MSGQLMDAMMANMRGYGVTASPAWLALRDSVRTNITLLREAPRRQSPHANAGPRRPDASPDGDADSGVGNAHGPMGMGCRW